ncbi:hypothetical protein JG687_00016425 [Phytophthora cactorum]|uniref:Uncharacterized protein n=1 Tax=Phytophthora cactorum TaxID=29920 RepID=A0A8T1TW10_9STRA|nr:hypothetical protein JG687_00016425 [Phytophthora cactorum]
MLQLDGPFYDFIKNRKPPSYESVNAHQRLVHADREKPLRLRPRRCKHSAQTKYVSGRTQSPRNEHETTRSNAPGIWKTWCENSGSACNISRVTYFKGLLPNWSVSRPEFI